MQVLPPPGSASGPLLHADLPPGAGPCSLVQDQGTQKVMSEEVLNTASLTLTSTLT